MAASAEALTEDGIEAPGLILRGWEVRQVTSHQGKVLVLGPVIAYGLFKRAGSFSSGAEVAAAGGGSGGGAGATGWDDPTSHLTAAGLALLSSSSSSSSSLSDRSVTDTSNPTSESDSEEAAASAAAAMQRWREEHEQKQRRRQRHQQRFLWDCELSMMDFASVAPLGSEASERWLFHLAAVAAR